MSTPWRLAYQQALDQDDDSAGFEVLNPPVATDKPLLLWIHPGDAIEDEEAFDDPDDFHFSCDLQRLMGEEILKRSPTHQVVVLHRQSSAWAFDQEHAEGTYLYAFDQVAERPDTLHLYGDDLEAAGAWMAQHLLATPRPVFLTGAYSDAHYGCVSAIGNALQARTTAPLALSAYSPSDPGSTDGQWKPRPVPPPAPVSTAPRPRRTP